MPSTLYLTNSSNSNTEVFSYSGAVASWSVPSYVHSVTITIKGAQGSGLGGRAIGSLDVSPSTTYYYNIGSQAGYNGGGWGGAGSGSPHCGGGMSWFSGQNTFTQGSVIIVAGGGGGSGGSGNGSGGGSGGDGGGTTGNSGSDGGDSRAGRGGGGGTQAAGGGGGNHGLPDNGATAGTAGSAAQGGVGGDGQPGQLAYCGGGGGGGGGYYGGGGGGGGEYNVGGGGGGGGGGGSSFLSNSLFNTSTTSGIQTANGSLQLDYTYSYIYDSISISESVSFQIKKNVSVYSSIATSESVTLLIKSYEFKDYNAELITTNYKWMTSSLLTAQQNVVVTPYIKCKIVDDLVLSNQAMSSPNQPINGKAVQAPDDSILVVGKDSSLNLGFWKIKTTDNILTKLTSAPDVILVSSGSWASAFNSSVNVSEWYNGTYVIDVYYWGIGSGNYINVSHRRSIDGGTTFSQNFSLTDPVIDGTSQTYISLAAGKPNLTSNDNIDGVVFFIKDAGVGQYQLKYAYYPGTGSVFGTNIVATSYLDSGDWVMSSIDSFYKQGIYYVVFSGYHTQYEQTNDNFSLYLTKLQKLSNLSTSDIWTPAKEILTSLSSSVNNQNNFKCPNLNFDGTSLWLTFLGNIVDSISETSVVTLMPNYYLSKSVDFENFTYPTQVILSDGTEFSDTLANSFVFQTPYYYLLGNGKLWQYVKNNIVADVTGDVLQYQIDEVAQSPSSLQLIVGNQDNQWYGASPTKTGAAAINNNRKILLYQGYYNSSNIGEYIPRNTYFIDNIKTYITSMRNDLDIEARDLGKKLRTLITKFTYNFKGPDFYFDTFDGSTISNWNQKYGSWTETGNMFTPLVTPDSTNDFISVLSNIVQKTHSCLLSVLLKPPLSTGSGSVYIFPIWKDESNWIRLRITANGSGHNIYIEKNINGTITQLYTVAYNLADSDWVPVYIMKHNYTDLYFILGASAYTSRVDSFKSSSLLGDTEVNTSGITFWGGVTVAIGCKNFAGEFKDFKFIQFNDSLNIRELIKNLSAKAEIFDFKTQNLLEDYLFDSTKWSGTFTSLNRMLTLSAGNFAMRNDTQFADAEIEFDARVTPTDLSQNYGLDFIFRNQSLANLTQCYLFSIQKRIDVSSVVHISARFIDNNTSIYGNSDIMCSSPEKVPIRFNNLVVDITGWHHYKVVFNKGLMFGFIDDIMVLAWIDNNLDALYSTGYIGFNARTNSKLEVKNIISSYFWNQVDMFNMNPGDDFDTAVNSLLGITRAFRLTDLFGRLKVVVLKSSDTSNYTYQNQLTSQLADQSDKEYVNQITVIGTGVQAIARDKSLIGLNSIIRDNVIVDYKVKTLKEAQDRADYELANTNRFILQSDPKQLNNVGAEILDVVTINNTGMNSSNFNTDVRIYNQNIILNSQNGEYSISLGSGKKT